MKGFEITDEMLSAGYNAMRDPKTNLPADWIVLGTALKVFVAMLNAAPKNFAIVPLHMTAEMERVVEQEDWEWAELLAAAEAVTEEQYAVAATSAPLERDAVLQDARDSLAELVNLCAIGDVDENTEVHGWGDALKNANSTLVKLDVALSQPGGATNTADWWEPLEEDPKERKTFDHFVREIRNGDPRIQIAQALAVWSMNTPGSQYSEMCKILANEVAKLHVSPQKL